jgi:hypothetical protein
MMSEAMLNTIVSVVSIPIASDWTENIQAWGELVQKHRDYVDGKHRLEMTQEVADLLMIEKDDGERFTVNYCRLIMQKLADRLKVVSVKGVAAGPDDESEELIEIAQNTSKALTKWSDRFRRKTRFDGLQIDTHEDTITSGDNFIMIDSAPLKDGEEFPAMIVEPAYNGETGIVPIYDLKQQNMVAVLKIWQSHTQEKTTGKGANENVTIITEYRVNVYYPDRLERFVTDDGNIKKFVANGDNSHVTPWIDPVTNEPLGIPFVHFKNDGRSGKWNGESGIKAAIPANDVLNNAMKDMTLITTLTGAQIRYIIGAETPGGKVTPGMWVQIGPKAGISNEHHMPKVGTFEIGQITPVIEEAQFCIEQISNVTDTSLPSTMGSSAASGEALKQREIGFTARVEKLQTKWGNNWEDVFALAYQVQMALGTIKPPEGADSWETIWKPAEVRNDTEVVDNALKIAPVVDRRTVIEEVAPVYNWDEQRIETILERLAQETMSDNSAQPPPPITPGSFAATLDGGLDALAAAAAATGG